MLKDSALPPARWNSDRPRQGLVAIAYGGKAVAGTTILPPGQLARPRTATGAAGGPAGHVRARQGRGRCSTRPARRSGDGDGLARLQGQAHQAAPVGPEQQHPGPERGQARCRMVQGPRPDHRVRGARTRALTATASGTTRATPTARLRPAVLDLDGYADPANGCSRTPPPRSRARTKRAGRARSSTKPWRTRSTRSTPRPAQVLHRQGSGGHVRGRTAVRTPSTPSCSRPSTPRSGRAGSQPDRR